MPKILEYYYQAHRVSSANSSLIPTFIYFRSGPMPMYIYCRDYSVQIPFTRSMFKFATQVQVEVLELSILVLNVG